MNHTVDKPVPPAPHDPGCQRPGYDWSRANWSPLLMAGPPRGRCRDCGAASGEVPTTRDGWQAIYNVDPEQSPATLARLARHMPRDLRAWAVSITWANLGYPGRMLPRAEWVKLWRSGGFTVNNERTRRPPNRPLRLFRSATPGWERGLSWSPYRSAVDALRWMIADKDSGPRVWHGANSADPRETDALIYETLAPPSAMLGMYHGIPEGHDRDLLLEVVLDTTRLRITEVR